ncbi:MAG TPA: FG-GAP-like repeat-containing protein [Verrucomicrobiae bacterium]|nr:FG-GAP-like repeat-containing protein [Verrucomicrobiae bacterium]
MCVSRKSLILARLSLGVITLLSLSAASAGLSSAPGAALASQAQNVSSPGASGANALTPVQFGPPAVLAPGVLRFAPAVIAPDSGDTRVAPLGGLLAPGHFAAALALPPLGAANPMELTQLANAASAAQNHGRLLLGLGRAFAQALTVNPATTGPTNWTLLPNGWRIWTAEISSAGAAGLRVHLQNLLLPPGAQMLVYAPDQPAPGTPITAATLNGQSEAWTETVLGNTVAVECQLPPETDPGKVAFSITGVSHLYLLPGAQPQGSTCENDIACYPAWLTPANGVARIGFVETGNTYLCTGCLLNTVPTTYSPYFLTANHCILNQTVASTLELWWFYQSSTCNGTPPSVTSVPHTSGGADFLATFGPNDFTFLRLRQPPPAGVQYLGWTATPPAIGTAIVTLHHPGGNPTKISFGNITRSDSSFWYIQWNNGVTENGSSGSPLLNSSQQVLGQLYGGYSSCTTPNGIDQFGRFDVTFPYVEQWLQPSTTKVLSLGGNLNFGGVQAGQRATSPLVIHNSGTGNLTVSGISYPSGFSGAWSGTVPPNASHTVTVTFAPTGQYVYGGTITVSSDASSGNNSTATFGTGYLPLSHAWTVWWQDAGGNLTAWTMSGANATRTVQLQPGNSGARWSASGTGDFNHDGRTDLLFESGSGNVAVWLLNGFNQLSSTLLTPNQVDPQWQIAGTGNFNGQSDILWQHADGEIAVWLMNGTRATSTSPFNPSNGDPTWHLVGAADLNGDSHTDLIWQNDDGRVAAWLMNGTTRVSSVYLSPSQVNPGWKIVGVWDFNGDGHPGLVWENGSGAMSYWEMAGVTQVHSGYLNPASVDPSWRVVGPK